MIDRGVGLVSGETHDDELGYQAGKGVQSGVIRCLSQFDDDAVRWAGVGQ